MAPQEDGGMRAWLCVAVVFINYMLMVGVSKCFSLVYMLALERFQGSATATAWVGSLQTVLRLGLGPIVSALINRFGIRPLVVIGGFGQAVAYILSGLAPSLFTFTLSFGLLIGIFGSLVYVPSQFILTYYFDKRKGLAYAVACSGMGVGIFLLPPFYYYTEQRYGFFGAMLIMGGLMLNMLTSGIMFKIPKENTRVQNNDGDCGANNTSVTDRKKQYEINLLEPTRKQNLLDQENTLDPTQLKNPNGTLDSGDNFSNGEIMHRRFEDQDEKDNINLPGQQMKPNGNSNINTGRYTNTHFSSMQSTEKLNGQVDSTISAVNGVSSTKKNTETVISCNRQSRNIKSLSIGTKRLFNLKLLCNKTFLSLILWTAAITLACSVHSTFNVALMVDHGISQNKSAILISITGIADIVGNFITGVVYDLKVVQRHKMLYYAFFMMVLGTVVTITPMIPSFPVQTVLFALYGMTAAPVCTLRVPLISEAVGKENLPDAVGIMLITHGSGYIVGPFVGGLIADNLGSYSLPFYLTGINLCLCSIICSVQHFITYRNQQNK